MGWEVRAWKRADAPELLRMLREWAELEGGPRPSCEEVHSMEPSPPPWSWWRSAADPPWGVSPWPRGGSAHGGAVTSAWGSSGCPPRCETKVFRSCFCVGWPRLQWLRAVLSCGWRCRGGPPGTSPQWGPPIWGQPRGGWGSPSRGPHCGSWRGPPPPHRGSSPPPPHQ
ncbi:basic salivary proline-rich protein 4-like isoform X4 [Gallus gallus]|uniref:basic salivary proline-rich protein 4-like isoform X4 n=1 Tax=Gallus gallus TaxID=9031 RepID=UPI001F022573|nr:basic salivary proline-rich protein 4-like isoform X4 [Gallus gallus]